MAGAVFREWLEMGPGQFGVTLLCLAAVAAGIERKLFGQVRVFADALHRIRPEPARRRRFVLPVDIVGADILDRLRSGVG